MIDPVDPTICPSGRDLQTTGHLQLQPGHKASLVRGPRTARCIVVESTVGYLALTFVILITNHPLPPATPARPNKHRLHCHRDLMGPTLGAPPVIALSPLPGDYA